MVYALGRFLIWFLAKMFFHFRIEGRINIPQGGAIIAPNHVSYWDPPLVGVAVGGANVYYMAKKELFRFPIFGTLLKSIHAFPVDRGKQNISAFRRAVSILNRGKILVVFPEGGRGKNRRLRPPQQGIAWLAHKTRLPVVPTMVVNSYRAKAFRRVTVRFGTPFYFDRNVDEENEKFHYQNFTSKVMEGIMSLDREGHYRQ